MSRGLYESYYINFCSAIPRPILEELASTTAANETSDQVTQVWKLGVDNVYTIAC